MVDGEIRVRGYLPREEVCWKTPLQESGWADGVLLRREELETVLRVNVVEVRVDMSASDNQETAIEDTDRARVPALRQKVEGLRVLEECAAFTCRGGAWLEDTEALVARMYSGVSREATRVPADTHLSSSATEGVEHE